MIRTTILFAFLALVTAKTFVASKTKVDNNLGEMEQWKIMLAAAAIRTVPKPGRRNNVATPTGKFRRTALMCS